MSNTNTPRTRLSWFAMFPEPYRQQAIENYEEDYDGFNGQSLFYDAADALFHGFDWDKNPQNQGFDYWAKFHDKLWRNEITLTPPVEEVESTPDYEAKTYTESEVLGMIEMFLKSDLSELEKHLLDPEMTEREFAKHALSFIKSKTESNETHNN